MFADLSIWHILILMAVLTLVFGAKRIPEIGSSIGKGIQEFKKGLRDVGSDANQAPPAAPRSAVPPPPPVNDAPKRLSE